jgi:hypothetical protein
MRENPYPLRIPMTVINAIAGATADGALPNAAIPGRGETWG